MVPEDKIYYTSKKIMKFISINRANNYNHWYTIGSCLHNIDDRLLVDWIKFSKKSPKYKPSECQNLWSKMKPNNYTIRTLLYYLKLDDPEMFYEILASF